MDDVCSYYYHLRISISIGKYLHGVALIMAWYRGIFLQDGCPQTISEIDRAINA